MLKACDGIHKHVMQRRPRLLLAFIIIIM